MREDTIVIIRFMGTSKTSSDIESVFKSIEEQLDYVFKTIEENKNSSILDAFSLAYSLENLLFDTGIDLISPSPKHKREFKDQLNYISEKYLKKTKLLILLDSIDQLREQDYNLNWLFNCLPKNVKIIYSVLKDYKNIFQNLKKKKITKTENILELESLNLELAKNILNSYLKSSKRQLSDIQEDIVNECFQNFKHISPLQVKLIFEISSKWKSTFIPNDDFFYCVSSIDIIKYNFKIIEKEIFDNEIFFKNCIFYLSLFEYKGISENELEDILSIDDQVLTTIFKHHHPPVRQFPMGMWFRLKYELRDYLTNKLVDETSVVAWYHRAFIEATNEYLSDYLGEKTNSMEYTNKDALLMNVIDYFTEKWNENRSNGVKGEKKPFIYTSNKPKRIEQMKRYFEFFEIGDTPNQIKCKAFRETTSQILKQENKYNKRKFNEFISVIEKIQSKELCFQIMKECLYDEAKSGQFFYHLQNHLNEDRIFTSNKNINLVFPASYFGHNDILEWLIGQNLKVNICNDCENGEFPIHLGKYRMV